MSQDLINPADSPDRQREKLLKIAEVLMRRVEEASETGGMAYRQFQRAVLLEEQVRQRTREIEVTLGLLNAANSRLSDARAEAEAARANLTSAIETIAEGFALFDPEDRLVLCNSRFGMHMPDLRPRLTPGLGFADYVRAAAHSPHLDLGQDGSAKAWMANRMRRHGDSHVVFNVPLTRDRWMQVSEHRTRQGGTVIIQTDITDIIRAERQERGKLLDDQARIIRATLDHISQGVCVFNPQRQLIGWNNRLAELLSLPLASLRLGLGAEQLVERIAGGADLALEAADLAGWIAAKGLRPNLAFDLQMASGRVLAVHGQGMGDGGFVMSFTDITAERRAVRVASQMNEILEARVRERTAELAEALAETERASAARARFVAAASHDLLQPLSAAKLFLASIPGPDLPEAVQGAVARSRNALASVEAILGALLDISRLDTGRASLDVGAIALGPMLAQLRDEFSPLAARKGLGLRILATGAHVHSDATYLRRILQNLIGNAIRYSLQGRVLVGLRRLGGGRVRIDVLDQGPGIAPHDQEAIFQEFHRLDGRASASEGMGLGLAIVQRAAQLLGHQITLASTPGRGSRFSLELALAPAPPPARAALMPPPAAPEAEGRIVLLVENDPDLRGALVGLLESWKLQVIDCASGEEALTLLAEIGIAPDRCLIDHHLGPGMNGLDLLAALRARFGVIEARLVTASPLGVSGAEGALVIAKPIRDEDLAGFVLG